MKAIQSAQKARKTHFFIDKTSKEDYIDVAKWVLVL